MEQLKSRHGALSVMMIRDQRHTNVCKQTVLPHFSQKTGFDISCKLSPVETICMESQILFSGENNKNIVNLLSADLT